jgi:GDPmannose 4,6-dehydratase
VREFVEQAFRVAGIEIEWRGSGPNEVAVAVGGTLAGEPAKGRTLVRIDPRYLRPTEVDTLLGDASKARARLGWRPRVGFEALVAEMIEADLREAERDHLVKSSGYPVYVQHE